jgi:hypothetical protein
MPNQREKERIRRCGAGELKGLWGRETRTAMENVDSDREFPLSIFVYHASFKPGGKAYGMKHCELTPETVSYHAGSSVKLMKNGCSHPRMSHLAAFLAVSFRCWYSSLRVKKKWKDTNT